MSVGLESPQAQQAPPSEPQVSAPEQQISASPSPSIPSTPSLDVRGTLKQNGYDVGGFNDDASALNALVSTAERYSQVKPLINYGRQYMQHAGEFQQWQQERQRQALEQAKQQQVATQKPAVEWSMPKYNQEWDKLTRFDPQIGAYVPVSEWVSPAVAEQRNAYAKALRENSERLLSDPFGLIKKYFGIPEEVTNLVEWFDRRADQRADERFSRYDAVSQTRAELQRNYAQYYQTDASGHPIIDPRTNEEALTPRGEALLHFATEARQSYGLNDPTQIQRYAYSQLAMAERAGMFNQQAAPQQQQAQAAAQQAAIDPSQTSAPRKRRFLDRAAQINSRNGTDRTGLPSQTLQNPDADIDELFNDALKQNGFIRH